MTTNISVVSPNASANQLLVQFNRAPRRAVLALATVVLVAACDESRKHSGAGDVGAWGADTLAATVAWQVGSGTEDPAYMFGEIAGFTVDGLARAYVADVMSSSVRVFGPDGRHITTIGRRGMGPGEFQQPTGPAVDAAGALYVRDESRVTRFATEGDAYRPASTWPGPPMPFSRESSRIDAEGRFFYPYKVGRTGTERHMYLVYDSRAGALVDTLEVPSFANLPTQTAWVRTGRGGGRMVDGLNRAPLSATPSWDVTLRGTLISGDGTSYVIAETNIAGDTVRRLSRPGPLPGIPEAERRDSAAALRARIAALPVPIDRVEGVPESVKSGIIPETYPAYLRLHSATDGRTWVERPPPAGRSGETFWDVWDSSGRFLGVVSVPVRLAVEPRPVFTASDIYGVARDPETEEQLFVRLSFSPPGHQASR